MKPTNQINTFDLTASQFISGPPSNSADKNDQPDSPQFKIPNTLEMKGKEPSKFSQDSFEDLEDEFNKIKKQEE